MSSGTTVLLDGGITILGLRIWATAAIALRDSAYTLTDFPTRQIQYSRILPETDVLITHYPPYGVLDSLPGEGFHAGCPELRRSVDVVKPKLHLFGHAHGCHGILSTSSTTFANACLMGADNGIDYAPIVFRMKVEEK